MHEIAILKCKSNQFNIEKEDINAQIDYPLKFAYVNLKLNFI